MHQVPIDYLVRGLFPSQQKHRAFVGVGESEVVHRLSAEMDDCAQSYVGTMT